MTEKRYLVGQLFFFWLSLFLIAVPAWAGQQQSMKKLSFLPQWSPQAQFAGYYMALHKGFYQRHGLDVEIITGGPRRPPTEYLRNGRADIASVWLSSALQLADEGVPIVNIGQVIQRSALALVAKTSSGIRRPEQINGLKVALWPADFQIQPTVFFQKFNLDNIIVTTERPVNLFLRDGVQVASVMWYNEYHTLINSGLDPEEMQLFFFDDVDLNFPEDGLYLLRETLERDPEAVCGFVAASLAGWRYAFANPEETVEYVLSVMENNHVPANGVHQRWMLERMRDLMMQTSEPMVLKKKDYQLVGDVLLSLGLIDDLPSHSSFFRNCISHAEK